MDVDSESCYHLNCVGGFLKLAGEKLQHNLTIKNGTPSRLKEKEWERERHQATIVNPALLWPHRSHFNSEI